MAEIDFGLGGSDPFRTYDPYNSGAGRGNTGFNGSGRSPVDFMPPPTEQAGGGSYNPYQFDADRRDSPGAPPSPPAPPPTPPSPTSTTTGNPWDQWANHPAFTSIRDAYRRYFGREPGGGEVWERLGYGQALDPVSINRQITSIANAWNLPDYRDRGAGYVPPTSASAAGGAPTGGSGGSVLDPDSFRQWFYGVTGERLTTDQLAALEPEITARGWKVRRNAEGRATKLIAPDGTIYDPIIDDDPGGQNLRAFNIDRGGSAGATPAPSVAGNQNVFSDPATSEWEQLLRTLTDRMNQPQPQYTPAQLEIMQTQALDPLERQRDAYKRQVVERMSARGIPLTSGIYEQALMDVDRQFNEFRTQTQADFARQEIGRQDERFAGDENRAVSALNLFQRIPQLADSRLATAQRALIPTDPYGAIGQGLYHDAFRQSQDQAFWVGLARLFQDLFR